MDRDGLRRLLEEVARAELQPRFHRVSGWRKTDGSLLTEADTAVQGRLTRELNARWPDIPLLGEEMEPAEQRRLLTQAERFWCLDPLDGTSNFAAGLPYYAISLALVERGEPVLGLVRDPQRDECFHAARGEGAWLNDQPLRLEAPPEQLRDCLALVDFKRLGPALAHRLMHSPPYRSQRSLGAVALDWCWLAAGRCHLYLHGGMQPWDYAAGGLVLREAGGALCFSQGLDTPCLSALGLEPRTGLGAVSPALLERWRDWILAG